MLRITEGLPPDIAELVTTIIDSAVALATKMATRELEQRFEFAWGQLFS